MRITIDQAVSLLKAGQVVALPTETVYGLAACLSNQTAIAKVFHLKGRPDDNPLIVHVASVDQVFDLVASVPENFNKILKFWPGPLTVVLPANLKRVLEIVRAGLPTVAIRMPDQKQILKVISQTGPLVASSANFSGKSPAICAKQVETDFGKKFPVLDGGFCEKGIASTVICLHEVGTNDRSPSWSCLREGAISFKELQKVLGPGAAIKT